MSQVLPIPVFAALLTAAPWSCQSSGEGDDSGPPVKLQEVVGSACDIQVDDGPAFCSAEAFQFCGWDGEAWTWSDCDEWECIPGEQSGGEVCQGNPPQWRWVDHGTDGSDGTPLVLSFDGAEPAAHPNLARFALGADCIRQDWPTAETPWLALDRDGDGRISDARELFGSWTGGVTRAHGFAALSTLDQNRDGVVDALDPAFSRLLLWADRDADKRSAASELTPLTDRGVARIDLQWQAERRCDPRGNCGVERAPFAWTDADGRPRAGEVIDLHLQCRPRAGGGRVLAP